MRHALSGSWARWGLEGLLALASLVVSIGAVASADDEPRPSAGRLTSAPLVTSPSRRMAIDVGRPLVLRTGFIPDPVVVRGQTAPDAPLSRLSPDCAGLSSSAPTQRVTLEGRFGFLRIFATSAADLTLAVQTPSGVVCSDDRFGRHPAIEGRFAPGELSIWVGVKGDPPRRAEPFEIELTETRSVRPGVRSGEEGERLALAIEAGLDVEAERGTSGDLRLRHGFLPDPRELTGALAPSRSVDASGLTDRCAGRVASAPSHVLTLRDALDFFQLYVVEAPEDVTLVVVGPDGSLECDTSEGGRARVTRDAWPEGAYRIYVGAARAEAAFPYRLGVSEIRRVR